MHTLPCTRKFMLGQLGGLPLRLSWFPRLVHHYKQAKAVPRDLEVLAIDLGIGKNMAKSMRVWAIATGVLNTQNELTSLARLMFDQRDPFLERNESVALMHWLINGNLNCFTASSWLFNLYRVSSFSIAESVNHFSDYLSSCGMNYSLGTIRKDMETIVRMHASVQDKKDEEIDDRFFYPMNLLNRRKVDGRTVFVRTWETSRSYLSPSVLTYALIQTLARRRTSMSSLNDLYLASNHHAAPGSVFGLTQDGFFAAVEEVVRVYAVHFSLNSMPDGDFELCAIGELGKRCLEGDLDIANTFYFDTY